MTPDPRFAGVTRTVGIRGGCPCVNGVPVEAIVDRFIAGEEIDRLAVYYGVPKVDIEAAIRFQHWWETTHRFNRHIDVVLPLTRQSGDLG